MILPIDLQALLVRMGTASRVQQMMQEGIVIAQSTVKAQQMGELAQRESSMVNPLRPHPDGNTRVDDERETAREREARKHRERKRKELKKKDRENFDDPFKGTVIDVKK